MQLRQELQLLIQVSEARVRIRFKLSRSDPFFDRGPPVVCFAAFLQLGCAKSGRRQVFELHPIETLDIPALICLNERVQFAICDAIQYPPVCANLLH